MNLAKKIRSRVRERTWAKALGDARVRYHPRALALLISGQRWQRSRLAGKLRSRDGQIQNGRTLELLRWSVGRIARGPQARLHQSTDEATQERGLAIEESDGVRYPSIKGERGTDRSLVSVVIPCYNQAHFLAEAIESVLAQSYSHFEIIVVDDGSTDKTSEVAARFPGVRCVRQENQGLSGARNTGLRECKGSYAVFLDADDRLLPEALAAGLECFKAHPECAFVYGDYNLIAGDGSLLKRIRRGVVGKDRYLALLRGNHISMHATVMYRRSVFNFVGGFDTSLGTCEDYDLYLRIARKSAVHPAHHYEKVVAEYRKHSTNVTRNSALMLAGAVTVLRRQRRHVRKNRQYKEAYKDGVKYFCHILFGEPLVEETRTSVRKRDWKRVLRNVLVLLWYYPQGLILLLLNQQRVEQYVERREHARRLNRHRYALEVHRQRLEELEGSQQSEGTLANEPLEMQQLRNSMRRIERRMRKLAQPEHKRRIRTSPRSVRQGKDDKKVVDLTLRLRNIVVRTHQMFKHYMRQLRRLVRRNLIRRVRTRVRRLRRSVELVRLLGFSQAMRFLTRRLLGAHMAVLRVPGVRTPLFCRTLGSDRWVLRGVFWAQQYEVALQDSPQLIIDGGANVGYASVYFANKYPDAQIIAIEPDPGNCALFRKNCASYPNVELIQGGLWTSSTDLVIENSTAESWAFRVVEAPSSIARSFKGFTVADILRRSGKRHIDLLKLDVEGAEEQLFSANYESWIGCVKNLVIEVHSQHSRDVVFTATNGRGFSVSQSGAHVVLKKEASRDQPKQEESIR